MEVLDFELVQRCLNGDQDAFAELVNRYKRLIYSVVYHYIKDSEEVNDISQEVFLRIYKSLGSFNNEYKFSTWAVRIATNLCIDIIRKRKIKSVPMEEIEKVSRENDTPEKRYLGRERTAEIRDAINRLPEKYKTLIVLYHQNGMSYKEMSDKLNKPLSMIKNRLYRARLILRDSLSGAQA